MVRERDVCWEYCDKLDGNKVRCKFCQKVLNGGISRLKHHLSRLPSKGVHPCSKVRDEVTDRVRAIIAMKEEGKEAATAKKQRPSEATKSPIITSSSKAIIPIEAMSPMKNMFFSNAMVRPIQPPLDVERCIAEFFFENRLDFSIARSPSFQLMLEAVASCGHGFRGPAPEALKTTWLQKLKSEVSLQVKEIEKEWSTTGCTIIADTWTDNKSRAYINFLVSSPSGTFFHKSVDASTCFKNIKFLCNLFDSVIQDFGPENIVQVIMDGSLSHVGVRSHIEQSYNGKIFCTPCASHCLNLILEDFSKIDWVNRCILQAQSITRFIYNHVWVLELMKKFTGGQDLVITSITKSASNFLSLQALLKQKSRLKHMFNGPEYSSSPYANRPHSISCMDNLEDNDFWRGIEEIAAVAEPILKVLRDVSGGKPAVGSIYELMTKAKESIRTYYIMDESKCKTFLEIIDDRWRKELHSPLHGAAAFLNPSIQYNQDVKFLGIIKVDFLHVLDMLLLSSEVQEDITGQIFAFKKSTGMFDSKLARGARNTTSPGMWWEQYGDSAPALQRVAVRILSQVCSASTFEKNWGTFQQVHAEKRNKLDKEALNSLLYVHYNLKLMGRGKPADMDPIILDDIDMSSEWVEETEHPTPTQWLDRYSSPLDGGDLNTRQFNSTLFTPSDPIFNL
ncbi:hypothetical protein QJS10_CPA01g02214 [Acorus calamus]|uniref:BED-type domain-containing protein n=1 Tax=Acorus calamus TaxID=4465 RepID=A0AAV9FEX4_ACOCL|nr:hypothetical protein QJS10_CPA01g02214 [Acorus calamus]